MSMPPHKTVTTPNLIENIGPVNINRLGMVSSLFEQLSPAR
jgi:hypothetical protein